MSRGFRELESITADLGIEAWGVSLEDAFAAAAEGLAYLIAELPEGHEPLERKVRVESDSLPSLLVQFLNEIIYLEETQGFIPDHVTDLKIRDEHLDATLTGAAFDPDTHILKAQVKAATYHGLQIVEESDEVRIRVIFDV